MSKEETITMNKSTLWQVVSGVLGVLLVLSVLTGGFGISAGSANQGSNPAAAPSQPSQPSQPSGSGARLDVSVDDDPMKGAEDAPVTIVEFSDFECPFCGRFYSQTLSQIEENYVQTGQVKFVYRDFPLSSIHPNAQKAAEAAECADDQGMFWEYHDTLFENQGALGSSSLKQYAADLGLDTATFNQCLESGKYESEVQSDFDDGTSLGVSGTPTLFINGVKVVGAQPYAVVQQIIEEELGN